MGSILSGSGTSYQVFTPFYTKCLSLQETIKVNSKFPYVVFHTKPPGALKNIDQYYKTNPHLKVIGGRENALAILKLKAAFKNYDLNRDFPYMDKTTKLGAYIKFGCISIREAFHAFKPVTGLLRELLFREYYSHATWWHPQVLSGKSFKHINIKWNALHTSTIYHACIMNAKTGFPIIDAAIRELFLTGWMNNRLRMIVASFITKDLMLDWHVYERKLFAKHLVDYDPSVNCHSWQGAAGVGIDTSPYWRVMNPWRQTEKFDKDCRYIKKYLPELADVPAEDILAWRTQKPLYNSVYLSPMVDHEVQVKKYLSHFLKFTTSIKK